MKNSLRVYQEEYEQWWKIYHHTMAKARKCTNPEDVTLFLRLWSGQTDGEMAEGLSSDTEDILAGNYACFFDGFLGLPAGERAALVAHFCPLGGPETIAKSLRQALKNPRYEASAKEILQRVESKQCE